MRDIIDLVLLLTESFGYPAKPDPERQEKIKAVIRILTKNPKIAPFKDRIRVFGGVARGNPDAGDIDVMLDFSDMHYENVVFQPNIDVFLSLARKYYGLVDVFVKLKNGMLVRNEFATGWDNAKAARTIWAAVKAEGKSLDDVSTWPSPPS